MIKNVLTTLLTVLMLVGIYYQVTAAYVIGYIVYSVFTLLILLGIAILSSSSKESIAAAVGAINGYKIAWSFLLSLGIWSVFYVSNAYGLLIFGLFNFLLTMLFINKLYTIQKEQTNAIML